MLKQRLVHPEILESLASAGHGAKVLLSDFNYAHQTRLGDNATIVYANFAPGLVGVTPLLELIADAVPIEHAQVMEPMRKGPYAVKGDPKVWAEYKEVLKDKAGFTGEFEQIERFDFYEEAAEDDVCLTIATGEQAYYANILLTIGAIPPE